MNKFIVSIFLFFFTFQLFSQEKKLKEYSHTYFFKIISAEKDSVFKLKDAFFKQPSPSGTVREMSDVAI